MMRFAALSTLAILLPSAVSAAGLTQAEVLQLMTASGMALKGGQVVNPCGHATEPKLKFVDLSGDGQAEAVAMDHDPACYGPDPGYQTKILARDQNGQWRKIGVALGVFKPLATRTHGWAEFTIVGRGCQPVFAFNGMEYLVAKSCGDAPAVAAGAAPRRTQAPTRDEAAAPVVAPTPSDALAKFPETYGSFAPGGDCTRLPRVTVSASAIRFETAAGSSSFPKPDFSATYAGPEDHSITYSLEGNWDGLIVSIDINTLSIYGGNRLSAAERTVAAIADKDQLARCGKKLPEREADPDPPPMRSTAAKSVAEFADTGVMTDPGFKRAYLAALGPLVREDWLIDMEGPGAQEPVTFAGESYLQVKVCKPHDCGDNTMMVVYRPETGALYGVVTVHRRATRIGHPPAALVRELDRMAKAAWAPQ